MSLHGSDGERKKKVGSTTLAVEVGSSCGVKITLSIKENKNMTFRYESSVEDCFKKKIGWGIQQRKEYFTPEVTPASTHTNN
jgi:hypothetical protein